jgi:hypothetical protein
VQQGVAFFLTWASAVRCRLRQSFAACSGWQSIRLVSVGFTINKKFLQEKSVLKNDISGLQRFHGQLRDFFAGFSRVR